MSKDLINFSIQIIYNICIWFNVYKIFKDKEVKGVSLLVSLFFGLAPLWAMYYFFKLGQPLSVISSFLMCLGNLVWLIFACYYRKLEKDRKRVIISINNEHLPAGQ